MCGAYEFSTIMIIKHVRLKDVLLENTLYHLMTKLYNHSLHEIKQ